MNPNDLPTKELRYPAKANDLNELRQHVADCPVWALRKFAVEYDGKVLGYESARRLAYPAT